MENLSDLTKLMVFAPIASLFAVSVFKAGTLIFDMLSEEFYAIKHA